MEKKYNFSFAIGKLRKDRNIELKDLAKMANISYSLLRQTEKGIRNNPTARTVAQIADALGITKQYIFDLAELAPECEEKTGKNN